MPSCYNWRAGYWQPIGKFFFKSLTKKKKDKFPSKNIHFVSYTLQSKRKRTRAETQGRLKRNGSSFAGYSKNAYWYSKVQKSVNSLVIILTVYQTRLLLLSFLYPFQLGRAKNGNSKFTLVVARLSAIYVPLKWWPESVNGLLNLTVHQHTIWQQHHQMNWYVSVLPNV